MLDRFSRGIVVPSRVVFFMWAIFFVEITFHMDFSRYGILPRSIIGLLGVLLSPLLHGGVGHLVSNTMPLLFLGTALYMFYDRIADRVFLQCYFLTGLLVWIFGRPFIHIGASGLIYGLASFLIFIGFFRQDFRSILISLITIFLYNGLFYGLLPMQQGVSWESHLLGGLVGFVSAVQAGKVRRVST
jgi:membrane associated rhomboid family serine protease